MTLSKERMREVLQNVRADRTLNGLCPQCGKIMVYVESVHHNKDYTLHCLSCKIYYRDRYELKTYGRLLTEEEREYRMNLINSTEVSKMLGISRAAVSQRLKRQREKGNTTSPLPEPIHFLNESTPLWDREAIEDYIIVQAKDHIETKKAPT